MFQPIRTERLVLRPVEPDDVESIHQRRNDPEVARYQSWEVPYPRSRTELLVADVTASDGPVNDDWWMLTVAEAPSGEPVGDLALYLSDEGRTAEVGYTLAARHWGRGFATEALAALLLRLFDDMGVGRVAARLHPDNRASALVLERTGFRYEGLTRESFRLGDVISDDLLYGLTRSDWLDWIDRPRHPPASVALVEITAENQRQVGALETHASQRAFVPPVPIAFGDALFPPLVDGQPMPLWLRAVEADGDLVGFVMMARTTDHLPGQPFLVRLLVDRRHQRRGVASRVLDLLEDQCRRWEATVLAVSWRQGRGSPERFYLDRGFVPTGRSLDDDYDQVEARKVLTDGS